MKSAAILIAALLTSGVPARAQAPADCTLDTLTTGFPSRWLGSRVGQVTHQARNVAEGEGALRALLRSMHWPTHLAIATNELSFAPGNLVDSLEVQESVRRLLRTRLFTEVVLTGQRCGETTDFTIWTRDAWSIRGSARVNRDDSRLALSEVNLFGTARSVTIQLSDINARRSFDFGFADPYVFNSRVRAGALLRSYADGRSWSWDVRTRDASPRDEWRVALLGQQARRLSDDSSTNTHIDIIKRTESASFAKLVYLEPRAAWAVIGGVEHERSDMTVVALAPMLGRPEVRRQFVAPLLGVARRSMEFGSIDWLVPGQPKAELPLGVEGEAVVSYGVETRSRTDITHFDGWVGGTAMLNKSTVFTGDLWTSGYWNRDSVSNGNIRFSGAVYDRAWKGMWLLRGTYERLFNPDPDVFALTTVDPFLRTLAPNSRLAETASSITLERSFTLYSTEGRWALNGALFGTYVDRQRLINSTTLTETNLHPTILGLGLRRILYHPTQAPVRLDIARAIFHSTTIPDRWLFVLSSAPWISVDRGRAGARDNTR